MLRLPTRDGVGVHDVPPSPLVQAITVWLDAPSGLSRTIG
jgi:hypothetical protein